jgi:hypothetical protein
MNGTEQSNLPSNSKVIHFVVGTVCIAALISVGTQAWCYLTKVPDMNTPLSSAFIHVTDTLVGALIAMLINTRPASQQKVDDKTPVVVTPIPIASTEPTTVKVEQPADQPIPVAETAKTGDTPVQS